MKLILIVLFLILSLNYIISVDKKVNELNLSPPLINEKIQSLSNHQVSENKSIHSLKNVNLKNDQPNPVQDKIKIESPNTQINSFNTEIFISKNECSAKIKETVFFTIGNGVFNSITRRISLDGSADSISGFKLASA